MSKNGHPGIPTDDEAKALLEPLVPVLLESFWEAWEWTTDLLASDDRARMILNTGSVACIVSDAFGFFARPRLVTDFKAAWTSSGRFHRAVIKRAISLRFKKLTPDLHSMNVRTEEQRKVYEQDGVLFANKPIVNITLGYTLDAVASKPTGVYFVCPRKDSPLPPDAVVEDVLDVDIRLKKRKRENG